MLMAYKAAMADADYAKTYILMPTYTPCCRQQHMMPPRATVVTAADGDSRAMLRGACSLLPCYAVMPYTYVRRHFAYALPP